MKIKLAGAFILLSISTTFGAAKLEEPKKPFSSLSLEQEIVLSDTTGVLNPNAIIRLSPSDNVKIYLGDGLVVHGIVKETEIINGDQCKVFGEMTSEKNCGFGFYMNRDGMFAGAVVFRDTETTYTIKFSEAAKGYIFVKSLGKKILPSSMKKN